MPSVKLDELENATILVDDGEGSAKALVARDTGMIHLLNDDYMDEEAPVPGDFDAGDAYVSVPAASTLGLGRELMFRFAATHLAGERDRVRELFERGDGYDRFARLVEERGLLDSWYRFREEETRVALEGWCRQHGLQLEG
ncbi:hypothetical protein AB4Z32_19665 [Massilia sp. 2TAF26]|uniref:hypothetical protein n=1 Tax=Massilia sp. 2TAF26 TaxID=3233012 RepID=UPI003F9C808F